MNKVLDMIAYLNKVFDAYQKKKKLCESVRKKEFDLQEEENRSADEFNKELILPDISSYFDLSLTSEDRFNIKTEFMREFDQFEMDYVAAKSCFNQELAKREKQMEDEVQKSKEAYRKQISDIDDFLRSVPLSAEYYEYIPELTRLINEGSADTIEKAVSVLSNRKSNSIYY